LGFQVQRTQRICRHMSLFTTHEFKLYPVLCLCRPMKNRRVSRIHTCLVYTHSLAIVCGAPP
jgi:hypothetical protein